MRCGEEAEKDNMSGLDAVLNQHSYRLDHGVSCTCRHRKCEVRHASHPSGYNVTSLGEVMTVYTFKLADLCSQKAGSISQFNYYYFCIIPPKVLSRSLADLPVSLDRLSFFHPVSTHQLNLMSPPPPT